MNKICTTIEQSKKLIELGIDVNTADMYWSRCTITDFGDSILKVSYAVEPCNISQFRYTKEDIPAWSLSALLGLIPNDDKNYEYYVNTSSHSDYHNVSYVNCWDSCIHSEYSEDSLFDAVFQMVCWLKENNKL